MNRHLSQSIRAVLRQVGITTAQHCIHGRKYKVPLECTSLRHLLRTVNILHEGSFYHQVLTLLRPGDVVFDIGAHLGKYVVGFADRLAPRGRVIAFEANPATARHLEQIVRLNHLCDLVTVINNAVGETPGLISLILQGSGCDPGQSLFNAAGKSTAQVPMTTVDQYVAESGVVPNLMKIDVEGYELKVLHGARRTLAEHAPKLCCEIHPRQLKQLSFSPADVEHFLGGLGYFAQAETSHAHDANDSQRPYDLVFKKEIGRVAA